MANIARTQARQILDSRGNPTIEVDVILDDGSFGRAAVPSGASTGSREVLELRDGGAEYLGRGVATAVSNVQTRIQPAILNKSWIQSELDKELNTLDGTENKSKLGANAILGVSLAFAQAAAQSQKQPLFRYISGLFDNAPPTLPRPMFNIMNGGVHAGWSTDIQEYMIMPMRDESYSDSLRRSVEVFQHLGKLIASKGLSVNVGNEGGYAPSLQSNEEAFELILQAIERAGYTAGKDGDFLLGIDGAASEFFDNGVYRLKRNGSEFNTDQMVEWLVGLTQKYPLFSLEDCLAENDWNGWAQLTARLGSDHQIVGDDLLVTNITYVQKAIAGKNCNTLLVKPNQIGTLSETLQAMRLAMSAGWKTVPSHRSGETEDVFLAHLAVGTGAGQIKTGAPSRGERTAKYNELLRIEEVLRNQ